MLCNLNLLFVCSRNQWRSPTAERIFKTTDTHTKSAGTSESARIKVNRSHIEWADLIFVMEKDHKVRLYERFRNELNDKLIVVLDIPDEYGFMDEELQQMLKSSVEPYLI